MKNIVIILSILVLLTACGTPEVPQEPVSQPEPVSEPQETTGSGTVHEVKIKDFKYFPETITIKAGDTVKWTNEDRAPHDAQGDGWTTALLRKDQSDSETFDTPGTYDYICSIHPYMTGAVIVE